MKEIRTTITPPKLPKITPSYLKARAREYFERTGDNPCWNSEDYLSESDPRPWKYAHYVSYNRFGRRFWEETMRGIKGK